jgi:hypothetical protein
MESDGAQILLGSGAVGALCAVATSWIKARFARTKIEPQPLEVKGAPSYVTCEQCELKHKDVDNRLAAGTRAFEAIRAKMDADHSDVMRSIKNLYDRIAPVAESCAENGAAIRILLGENLKPRTKQ